MIKMKVKVLLLLICILSSGLTIAIVNQSFSDNTVSSESYLGYDNLHYKLLGNDTNGSVKISETIGNLSSNKTIAIIVGVHPPESRIHKTMIESLVKRNNTLKYKYNIYKIDTKFKNADNSSNKIYNESRMAGQLLGQKFIVPNINKGNYNLVIDVHSHNGKDKYKGKFFFINSPTYQNNIKNISGNLVNKTPSLKFEISNIKGKYDFQGVATSPTFITIPLIKKGVPTLIFEIYRYLPEEKERGYVNKFIDSLDDSL